MDVRKKCELNLTKPSRFWRSSKYVAISLLVLVLLAVCAIHVQERILRHRAESLLEDIRSLELRRARFFDVQKVFQRWNRWAKYEGACTDAHCEVRFTLQDFPLDLPEKYGWDISWPRRASMLVGGHPARVMAEVSIENGIVWRKGFYMGIIAPAYPGAPGLASTSEYTLIGTSDSRSRFDDREWGEGGVPFHPNYSIIAPSACEICVAAIVTFTPYADSKDVQRLMQFDFSCLTRWATCRLPADIMPVAWNEHLADKARMASPPPECGRDHIDVIGRDSENAAIVEVVAIRKQPTGEHDVDLRLVKRIKRAEFWDFGAARKVRFYDSQTRLLGSSGLDSIRPGVRLIILFQYGELSGVTLEDCGVRLFTPENLEIVTSGVQQHYAAFLPERAVSVK